LDKVFSYQSGEDLLNRADLDSKRQIKGADQRRSKDAIRGDQRDRSEMQRQRVRAHCKEVIVVTISEVVNKKK
jgi:hypothetical protein